MTPTQPPPSRRGRLSAERIVDEALELAREEGVSGISMRPLAARFGVSATALYGHVASRDALLGLMLDRVLSEVPAVRADLPWQETLRKTAMELRAAFSPYPQLALEALSGQAASDFSRKNSAVLRERLVTVGFTVEEADLAVTCWGRFTLSYLAAAEYVPAGNEALRDRAFEHGVELILSGLREQLADRTT